MTQTIVRVPDYTASDRQSKFHLAEADEVLYGGAAGGGKSAALAAHAVTLALRHPGIQIYMFRKTIPELKRTLIPEIMKQCAAYINYGHMTWHGSERQFRFKNGSVISMAYMDTAGDQYIYQGSEIHVPMFDELTHFLQDQYEYILTRIRDPLNKYPLMAMSATNPGGVGHGWVKNRFIDIGPAEQLYVDPETKKSRLFIPAKVSDHPVESFRVQYANQLGAISDESLRRALLEGDWDQFSGQVFTEWRREKHIVDPFTIPEHWIRWVSYDWGYGNNSYAAALWFAKDPQTLRTYIYREFYERGMVTSQQGETMKMLSAGENIKMWLGDPAIFKSRPNLEETETIDDVLRKAGLHFHPANNDRMAGKNAWHEFLSIADDGLPRGQVFNNCHNLIRTIPTLPYDAHKVEDVDTEAEDHLYDAGRYGLVAARSANVAKVYKPVKRSH